MSQVSLNTNLASLRTQRRITESSVGLRRTFERLSSGLRITHASDDAAGLAIAARLNTDARVFSQGVRNLNDGVSMLNVADGALEQLSTVTIRLRELATQSANGTLSVKQRKALNSEAQQLSKEYTRLIRTTKFNGQLLFDNEFGTLSLQAGYGSQGAIASGLGGAVGNGRFQPQEVYTSAPVGQDVAVGDFNRDGVQDLLVGGYSSNVSVLIGNGDGSFQSALSLPSGGTNSISVAVGDFNGDGNQDIAAANVGSNNVGILLGNGNGNFQSVQTFTTQSNPGGITVGDFNQDGKQDIATSNYSDTVSVLLGNGNGTFQTHASYSVGTGTLPYGIRAGDFNSDGVTDLVTANVGTGSIGLFLGSGDGTFSTVKLVSTGGGTAPTTITVGDLNGDGKSDVATGDNISGNVYFLLGTGEGTFQNPRQLITGVPGQVVFGDFDGDGISDLAVADSGAFDVEVYIGNGDATFQTVQSYTVGSNPYGLAMGDFNGDGVQDLATSNPGDGTTSILKGTARSGTAPLLPFDLTTQYQSLDAIAIFDKALTRIAQQRGTIGAFLSRVDTGISNLSQTTENYQSAESRIVDADIATEAADLAKYRILLQSSSAILAQANTLPELALLLLKG